MLKILYSKICLSISDEFCISLSRLYACVSVSLFPGFFIGGIVCPDPVPTTVETPVTSRPGTCKRPSWGYQEKGVKGQDCEEDGDCTRDFTRICCPVNVDGEVNPRRYIDYDFLFVFVRKVMRVERSWENVLR